MPFNEIVWRVGVGVLVGPLSVGAALLAVGAIFAGLTAAGLAAANILVAARFLFPLAWAGLAFAAAVERPLWRKSACVVLPVLILVPVTVALV